MRGRYGADELGNVAVGISIVLLVINAFAHTRDVRLRRTQHVGKRPLQRFCCNLGKA